DIKILQLSLRSADLCIESGTLDLSLKILERAAVRVERLEIFSGDDDVPIGRTLSAKYYMLRTLLAWHQTRPDLAEHMLCMIPEEAINNDLQLASELADLCYNVGQQAFSKGQFDLAAKWLEKAAKHNSRSLNAGDENSPNVKLRLIILHMTVRAYLEQNSGESRTKSLQTLEILISYYPNELAVLILWLEVMMKQGNPDHRIFYNRLETLVHVIELTDTNIKIILSYIQKLQEWSIEMCVRTLEQLLLRMPVLSDNEQWIDRLFVISIRLSTSSGVADSLSLLDAVATHLYDYLMKPLSQTTANASLIVRLGINP
ncbi:hypothetical protein Egran_02543, partial [Elaphomyces granulatus]